MTTDADERPDDQAAGSEPVAAPGQDDATAAAEQTQPAGDAPAPEPPAPDAAAPDSPTEDAAAQQPAEPAATAPEPANATAAAPEPPTADADADADAPAEAGAAAAEKKPKAAAKKPRRRKPRERRKPAPDLPKTRAPLPLDELRDASRSTMNLFGARQALRDSLTILAPRERQELNVLIAADEDHRPRARNIANGSLGAGRIDKAMAATIVSMAPQEDLWNVLLDKEQAAQKLGRIREAKQRDKQRADRAAERANRADRVSRDDMAKATDGRVGATIRFVTDEKRERRAKDEAPSKPEPNESVLDRLGY